MAFNNKLSVAVFIVLSLLIVISVIFLIKNLSGRYVLSHGDKPKKWIEEKPDGTKSIDLAKATDGASYIDDSGSQQWHDESFDTVFGYEGLYNGEYFRRHYTDENGIKMMEITPNLDPTNGIIEGIIIEKIKDDDVIAYVFLDEDWKTKVKNTNIVWGKDHEHFKKFNFNELSKGIYMDSVKEDRDRFAEDFKTHFGSLMVGSFTAQDVRDRGRTDGLTIIRII